MILLHEQIEKQKWDVRVIEKNLTRGVITPEEYTRYFKQLPDDSAYAEIVDLARLDQEPAAPEE